MNTDHESRGRRRRRRRRRTAGGVKDQVQVNERQRGSIVPSHQRWVVLSGWRERSAGRGSIWRWIKDRPILFGVKVHHFTLLRASFRSNENVTIKSVGVRGAWCWCLVLVLFDWTLTVPMSRECARIHPDPTFGRDQMKDKDSPGEHLKHRRHSIKLNAPCRIRETICLSCRRRKNPIFRSPLQSKVEVM